MNVSEVKVNREVLEKLREIWLFLDGQTELNGCTFGEQPQGRHAYWWRRELREAFESVYSSPSVIPATNCPGHGRSECVSCCWPKGMCTYLGNDPEGHKQAESYNAGLRAAQYQNLSAATWDGSGMPPVGLPVEAYFPRDTQPVWLTTKLLYVSDENVVYDDGGFGEIRKTRAEFDDLNVQFRKVKS